MVRRIALAALGVSSVWRGSSYVGPRSPDSAPAQLAFVDQVVPLSWYAVGWITTGAIALVAVFWKRLQPLGISTAIFFNLLWGGSFMLSWKFLDVPRADVSAISYFTIAILAMCVAALYEQSHALPGVEPPDLEGGDECRPLP
jgi:hypothetical protein